MYRSEVIVANPVPFFPDCIPEELRTHRQWVNWRYEVHTPGGKPTKVPKRPSGAYASHSNPATWSTWEQVLKGYDTGRFAGVGFVFSEEDPYTGIDFDHVRDPQTGEIDAWAWEWLQRLDSYTEVPIPNRPQGVGTR